VQHLRDSTLDNIHKSCLYVLVTS